MKQTRVAKGSSGKEQPKQISKTSSSSPEADGDSGLRSSIDGDDSVQPLLSGLLNALKYNEAPVIGGLLQSLRHDGTPQEIATHFRRNLESLQAWGILSEKELDDRALLLMASEVAGPQHRSDTQAEEGIHSLQSGTSRLEFPSSDQPGKPAMQLDQ